MYAGSVALDLYNAARLKEFALLHNEKGELQEYSVYDIPEADCIDGGIKYFSGMAAVSLFAGLSVISGLQIRSWSLRPVLCFSLYCGP